MFEQLLVPRTRDRRWGLKLGMAVGLHAAALGSVVLASNWGIDPVAPPPEVVVLNLPLPAPIEVTFPRQAPAPPAHPAETQPPPPRPRMGPTQPPVVPDTPPDTAPPEGSSSTTADTGETPSDGTEEASTTDSGGVPWGTGGPGDAAFGDDPQPVNASMVPPIVLFRVQPRYPDGARIARVEGIVVVQATIDRAGRVIDVQVVKGLPMGLDASAVAAVKQWRFQPATLQGRPVPVYFQLTVQFHIRS
ncbi:MAG TPA: energy transducer TonB [Thermoanaerobaculia bacterium]|jgi:protein TonB|nr:energy transducer TonB [Thermoanaerobaculia bacterium]